MGKITYKGREVDAVIMSDGQVHSPTDTMIDEVVKDVPDICLDDFQTKNERLLDDVETSAKPRSTDVETSAKPRPTEVQTLLERLATDSPTSGANLYKLMKLLTKDKARLELNNYPDVAKALKDNKLIKRLTSGFFTLETLPLTKQKEVTEYFEKTYQCSEAKTMQLVLITRIFKRVKRGWVAFFCALSFILGCSLVRITSSNKAEAQIVAEPRNNYVLPLEDREADSTFIANWCKKNKVLLTGCRYDMILADKNFHKGNEQQRSNIIRQQYNDMIKTLNSKTK